MTRDQDIVVIAPNLKRRLSGVTATIARLVPLQARQIGIVATGPGLPPETPHIPLIRVARLPRTRWRVFHARRNSEMLLGLILTRVLRRRFKLLFTSASQRTHSRYTKWLIRQMDDVIATSSRTAGYLDRPTHVILHGIDLDAFAPVPDKVQVRRGLGLPAQGPLIGCYGRIRAQKGTDVFVGAAITLCQQNPDLHAVVMGRATEGHGGFLDNLKDQVTQAGLADRIHFRPEVPVDQMPRWYAALDLFVAPQRWEGFGLTPIEAMACAVPTVATTVGAFEELVTQGQSGSLIPPGEVEAMAEAIEHWLTDDAALAKAGQFARRDMLARFQLQREADDLIAVYRALLGDDAPPAPQPPKDR